MLSDARSLWNTAQKAIAMVNENVTTALENFEADNFGDMRNIQNQQIAASSEMLQQLEHDLNEYKRLLEDAQMQHFELSKQSRTLVAEKEAELQQYRQKFGTLDGGKPTPSVASGADGPPEIGPDGTVSGLDYEKLYYEKKVLELSCDDLQSQLKEALHGQNEYQVLKKNHDDLTNRFTSMKADLVAMKSELDRKEKQKAETIENLVQEYSRLAAEAELSQTICNKRIAEVFQENEVLTTKMHALEHSITELADRSANAASPSSSATSFGVPTTAAATATPVVAMASAVEGDGHAPGNHLATLETELKESKAKMVNLQFDMKMKDDEINKLKAMFLEATAAAATATAAAGSSGGASTTSAESAVSPIESAEYKQLLTKLALETTQREGAVRDMERLQKELQQSSQDVSRLMEEKREAEDVGKSYLEQCKELEKEVASARAALAQSTDAKNEQSLALANANGEQTASLQSELAASAERIASLIAQSEQLEKQLTEQKDAVKQKTDEIAELSNKLESLSASAGDAANASKDEIATLSARVVQLEKQLADEKDATVQEAKLKDDEIAELSKKVESTSASLDTAVTAAAAEKQQLTERVAELEASISRQKDDFEGRLAAATEGSDSAQQALIAEYSAKIESLEGQYRTTQSELQSVTAELNTVKASLAESEASLRSKDEAICSAAAEKEQLLKTHSDELATLEKKVKEEAAAEAQKQQEEALAEAVAAAAVDKASALEVQKQQLEAEHKLSDAAARDAFASEKAAAIEETTAALEQAKAAALDAQQKQLLEQQQQALDALRVGKDAEIAAKLTALRDEKDEERRTALAVALAQAAAELKAAQDAAAEQLATVNKELAGVRAELAVAEEMYEDLYFLLFIFISNLPSLTILSFLFAFH